MEDDDGPTLGDNASPPNGENYSDPFFISEQHLYLCLVLAACAFVFPRMLRALILIVRQLASR